MIYLKRFLDEQKDYMNELSNIEGNNGINYFRTLWEEQFNKLRGE